MNGPPSDAFVSADIARVRANPLILGLAATPFMAALCLLVAGFATTSVWFALIPHAVIAGVVTMLAAYRYNPSPRFEPIDVHADKTGIVLGSERIDRSAIRQGLLLPKSFGRPRPRVHLARGRLSPSIKLDVPNEHAGRRLLRALGLDASQMVATFSILSRALAGSVWLRMLAGGAMGLLFVLMGALSRALHISHAVMPTFLLAFVFILATVFVARTKLDVGVDGLLLRWLGTTRFVPWSDVTTVTSYVHGFGRSRHIGVKLGLSSGKNLALPIGSVNWDKERHDLVLERIDEALEAYRKGDDHADASVLARGERDLPGWVAHLRSIGSGAQATFREAPVAVERLWRIVEDAAAEPLHRAAAAIAVAASGDDRAKARLRVAASATAAPKLRVALARVADGTDDEHLTEALAALDEAAQDATTDRRAAGA